MLPYDLTDTDYLTTDDEELREKAKETGYWPDYQLFSSNVNSALNHYCNKVSTVLNDNEITADNESLKSELSENLNNAKSTLEVLTSNDRDVMDSIKSKVWENRDMIKKALSLYEKDITLSSNNAAEKLNNMEFPRVQKELRAISSTITYMQNLKP